MKPWVKLGQAAVPGGGALVLTRRGDEHMLELDGVELMTSREHGSEEELARIACAPLASAKRGRARVLIGGLGMGFTLRAALDRLPPSSHVVVAELVAEVVAWNRGPLAGLNGSVLDDPRVAIEVADVAQVIRRAAQAPATRFDAIMLDVDNGPASIMLERNRSLYEPHGLGAFLDALAPGGIVAIWSLGNEPAAERNLRRAGLNATTHQVRARTGGRGGTRYIYAGRKPARDARAG